MRSRTRGSISLFWSLSPGPKQTNRAPAHLEMTIYARVCICYLSHGFPAPSPPPVAFTTFCHTPLGGRNEALPKHHSGRESILHTRLIFISRTSGDYTFAHSCINSCFFSSKCTKCVSLIGRSRSPVFVGHLSIET